MFMTRILRVMPTTTEQHLIVHSGRSKAEVAASNNKRLRSTVEPTTDGHKASHGFSATAELLDFFTKQVMFQLQFRLSVC